MNKKDLIQNSKRVVIKIGSALLVNKQNGSLNSTWLNSLALDIENFIKLKKEVIIVSSGSIALGKKQLKLKDNLSLEEKQAAAATGQISLAHAWKDTMGKHGLNICLLYTSPSPRD